MAWAQCQGLRDGIAEGTIVPSWGVNGDFGKSHYIFGLVYCNRNPDRVVAYIISKSFM